MTAPRLRPWFLPASLAALLTQTPPDGPADAPSDPGPGPTADPGSGRGHAGQATTPRSAGPRPGAPGPEN
ncbi:hypothetical protein GCM10010341_73780 [Streptomyces noursei]|nr:hypothetical protein GCM10010341_73780 [Streptomyces noursei]